MKRLWMITAIMCCLCHANAQLLYQITGKGIKGKSYIFATNKLCNISFLDTVPQLFKVFNECHTVITEMALNSADVQKVLAQAALLPDSTLLHSFYTKDEYERIDQALTTATKMSLKLLDRLKPAYITELYKTELYRTWLGYDENRSSEIFFQAVAAEQGKRIIGLNNTKESIYALFDHEPLEWQAQELLNLVKYPEREIRQAKALLALYKNGHLSEISYQVQMPDNQTTISYSDYKIYAARNIAWADQLTLLLQTPGNFIVLDAVYLGGDKGLIHLLRNIGFKIRSVN